MLIPESLVICIHILFTLQLIDENVDKCQLLSISILFFLFFFLSSGMRMILFTCSLRLVHRKKKKTKKFFVLLDSDLFHIIKNIIFQQKLLSTIESIEIIILKTAKKSIIHRKN